MKKKTKWQKQREKKASENSQFDPKIHELGREGFGFGVKKNVKIDPEELSGKNLPFSKDNDSR